MSAMLQVAFALVAHGYASLFHTALDNSENLA
jgi:hypothetical protein